MGFNAKICVNLIENHFYVKFENEIWYYKIS